MDTVQVLQSFPTELVIAFFEVAVAMIDFQLVDEGIDPTLGAIEFGSEESVINGADEVSEVGNRFEMIPAIALNPHLTDGLPGDELSGPGAGAGFADAEQGGDFVERQVLGCEVEETVDLSGGPGQTEQLTEPTGSLNGIETRSAEFVGDEGGHAEGERPGGKCRERSGRGTQATKIRPGSRSSGEAAPFAKVRRGLTPQMKRI